MRLRLYNTLTKSVEPFEAIDEQGRTVMFYTCGPTVYDYAHIGNFRSFLNADLLRRTLELIGYSVRHVMNMTDVGHMTDDDLADGGGEDKMAAAARRLREQKAKGELSGDSGDLDPADPFSIAEYYIRAFLSDARTLGIKVAREHEHDPSLMPRPTQYVQQMIDLVKDLIDRGHAYIADDGVVYFDVQSFPDYGKLSGNTPQRIRSGEGGRISAEHLQHKKHPADFMLWKPDPTHLMRWESPWGEGYPGWHLECSVMAQALLGDVIDIHSGGEDNIFPHHECEIAQTRGATGQPHFARYWFHTRHLIVEGEKMSKSLGNFFTVRDLLARGASPAAIRLALTSTHYRSNANFTMQALKDAQRRVDRWMRRRDELNQRAGASPPPAPSDEHNTPDPESTVLSRFTDAMCDDLNISGAIAVIDEHLDRIDSCETLDAMLRTLGLLDIEHTASMSVDDDLATTVESKIAQRDEARRAKDWNQADAIRDELLAMGIAIKDGPRGTTWERIVQ